MLHRTRRAGPAPARLERSRPRWFAPRPVRQPAIRFRKVRWPTERDASSELARHLEGKGPVGPTTHPRVMTKKLGNGIAYLGHLVLAALLVIPAMALDVLLASRSRKTRMSRTARRARWAPSFAYRE